MSEVTPEVSKLPEELLPKISVPQKEELVEVKRSVMEVSVKPETTFGFLLKQMVAAAFQPILVPVMMLLSYVLGKPISLFRFSIFVPKNQLPPNFQK